MKTLNARVRTMSALALAAMLAACASTPPDAPPAAANDSAPVAGAEAQATEKSAPPGQTRYKWTKATEAEVAAALDKKFQEAAKQFVQLERNDQVMFCKRFRDIGSMIPTLHCITEAELRKQVEDSDQVRDQMRQRMGKCDITVGCSAGG
jgi:hypothetical protein